MQAAAPRGRIDALDGSFVRVYAQDVRRLGEVSMFATIKNLIPEPRQADQPRHYVGRHRLTETITARATVPAPAAPPAAESIPATAPDSSSVPDFAARPSAPPLLTLVPAADDDAEEPVARAG
ncbi:hypothetical protein [Actinoplanes sp. NPDC051494]|uniref:hypothetical protein n=1 Tax=Actinoplanes sp. NPDC051494 TaxID=3363907 RepID=UPI00378C7520